MYKPLETAAVSVAQRSARGYGRPILLLAVWLIAALIGMYFLIEHANTPGQAGAAPKQWPGDGEITLNPAGDTLLMFVHPHCPCTRASLSELQRLLARISEPVTTWMVFYRPANMPAGWEQTDLWHNALATPGVHVVSDIDGAKARRFHVFTSGQTVLYDAKGQLLFSGGITGARGHEGDNAGETAIEDLVNASNSECRQTPVFGCPIVPNSVVEHKDSVSGP